MDIMTRAVRSIDLEPQTDAVEQLLELCGELEYMQQQARDLLKQFPEHLLQAEKSAVFQFGASTDAQTVTFRSIVADIEQHMGDWIDWKQRMSPTIPLQV